MGARDLSGRRSNARMVLVAHASAWNLPALFSSSVNLKLHEERNGVFKYQIRTNFRSIEIVSVTKNTRIRGEKSKIEEKR